MSKVTLNLKIYNRSYKVKVAAEEEAFMRKAAEEINELIDGFQKKYRGRDIQDYFALAMIARMTEIKPTIEDNSQELMDELTKIEKLIG